MPAFCMWPSNGRRKQCQRGDGEAGLLSTELSIIMPMMLILALLAVFMINVERHDSRAQQAADAAARAASLERTYDDALAAATRAAEEVCLRISISPGDFQFTPPVLDSFTPGQTSIVLTCWDEFVGFSPLVNDSTRSELGAAVSVIEYWLPEP